MEDYKKNKFIFLFTLQEINPEEGISKKILSEQRAFESNGFDCLLGRIERQSQNKFTYKIGNSIVQNYGGGVIGKLKKLYSYGGILQWITENRENIELIYIRYTHFSNYFYCNFLEILHNLGLKIAFEIPTFPYDKEYVNCGVITKLLHFEEMRTRRSLVKNVDRIITFSNDDEIWDRKTIKIHNAVDLSTIPIRTPMHKKQDTLNLLGVANLMFWHGYDRIIKGLYHYYKKPQSIKVFFHIVGGNPGSETYEELQDLVHKYNLFKYVTFHGVKSGGALDELFNTADIAIGCLGCHRKGLIHVQSIKNVEYAARGIPFVYSEINPLFDRAPYILKIPDNENIIDINSFIKFNMGLNVTPTDIRNSIKSLTWHNQIKQILDDFDTH